MSPVGGGIWWIAEADHPCSYALRCGAPIKETTYARHGKCLHGKNYPDGRCGLHSMDPTAVSKRRLTEWRRRNKPPVALEADDIAKWSAKNRVMLSYVSLLLVNRGHTT